MKTKKLLAGMLAAAAVSTAHAQTAQPTLEQRIEALETASYLNNIRFNGIFRTMYDNVNTSDSGTKHKYNPLRMYFALDSNAALSDRLQFSGRFAISKFFNPSAYTGSSTASPELAGSREEAAGQNIRLERAFINYKLTNDLSVTAGRLPTIDGPSYQFYDGIARQGAYPMLGYNSQLDGMALSYNIPGLGNHRLSIKGIYTPLYNASFTAANNALTQSSVSSSPGAPTRPEYSEITTAMLDYSAPSTSLWDEFNAIGMFVDVKNVKFGDSGAFQRGTELRAVLSSPAFGGNGLQPNASINSLVPSSGLAFSGSTLKMNYNVYVAYLEAKNLAKSGVDLAVTYIGTQTRSNGFLESNATTASTAKQMTGNALDLRKGVLTNNESNTANGGGVLITTAYHIPSAMLNNPTFGLEYFNANKNYLYFEYSNDNMTQFYSTRGQAYHAWYTQPLHNRDLKLRVGYMNQDHAYGKGFLGAPTKSTLVEQTLYTYLRLDF